MKRIDTNVKIESMRHLLLESGKRNAMQALIREEASYSTGYLIMNMLAAMIASYGLLANSPAVVIGAMLVAMLLGPIIGVSLSLVENDNALLKSSLGTLAIGALSVLVVGFIIGSIHNDIFLTDEILNRTAPNLIDLMIALAGGAVCIFAKTANRLSSGLIGAAIATALVPPLAAASILLARGEVELSLGALLLAFTNMVAIQLAASVSLWLVGFQKVTHATAGSTQALFRRNIVSVGLLVVLGVFLTTNLQTALEKQLFETNVSHILEEEMLKIKVADVENVRFDNTEKSVVNVDVYGTQEPQFEELKNIERKLPKANDGTETTLHIRFIQTKDIFQ
jgi:uncharacterized hydrophobic protein (TIGR00271 family)